MPQESRLQQRRDWVLQSLPVGAASQFHTGHSRRE